MASKHIRDKLRALLQRGLNKDRFEEDLVWLDSFRSWINFHCPTLQTYLIKGKSLAWVVAHPSPEKLDQIGHLDVRILINLDKTFELQVFKATVKQCEPGGLASKELILPYLHSFESGNNYVICKGLDKNCLSQLTHTPEHVRVWTGQDRLDSDSCQLWIEKENVVNLQTKTSHIGLCGDCITQSYVVTRALKRKANLSTPDKHARKTPGSHCNFRYLSPKSTKNRHAQNRTDKAYARKLLKKINGSDVDIDDDQNEQISEVCNVLEQLCQTSVNELFAEANEEKEGTGDILREIWEVDMENRRGSWKDQKSNVTGARGNKWNTITFRMALAVYVRSPAAYKALKGFKILQLPCVSTLKSFTRANQHDLGDEGNLKVRAEQYAALHLQKEKEG